MACGCQKNKQNAAAAMAANTVSKPVTSTNRPLSEGGRTRRAEKRMIR